RLSASSRSNPLSLHDALPISSAPVKVNTTGPIDPKTTSLMVDNLKNGTPYHFTVTALVGGAETDPIGPRPALHSGDELGDFVARSEEHTSELQSQSNIVCRLL